MANESEIITPLDLLIARIEKERRRALELADYYRDSATKQDEEAKMLADALLYLRRTTAIQTP